ncbi:MAG: DUF721 domain-containing protein [Armatimonadetes bacterium]|nr:DUF721 domain-containing protein [Armatimonadota bacterium]
MDFISAGNVLQKLVLDIAGPEFRNLVKIAFGWKKIVGKILAERTSIQKLEKKVLFVSVTNNVWMQELVLTKSKIIEKIKMVLNVEIEDIIFFIKQRKKRVRSV